MTEAEYCFLSYKDKPSPEKLKEVAREELGETEELKERCLEELRQLIRENEVTCCSTDDFLLRFLRARKFETKRSFQALRNYACQRKMFNKELLELRPVALEECVRQKIIGFLPYRDPQQRKIVFMTLGNWDTATISTKELWTLYCLFVDYVAAEEAAQIIGVSHLYDLRSTPVTHFFRCLQFGNRWKNFMFNSLPARISSIQFITNSVLEKLTRLLAMPLMPKKIADRVGFHEDAGETLFKHIPVSILPDEMGGNLAPLNTEDILETMVEHLQKVKDDYQYFRQDP